MKRIKLRDYVMNRILQIIVLTLIVSCTPNYQTVIKSDIYSKNQTVNSKEYSINYNILFEKILLNISSLYIRLSRMDKEVGIFEGEFSDNDLREYLASTDSVIMYKKSVYNKDGAGYYVQSNKVSAVDYIDIIYQPKIICWFSIIISQHDNPKVSTFVKYSITSGDKVDFLYTELQDFVTFKDEYLNEHVKLKILTPITKQILIDYN